MCKIIELNTGDYELNVVETKPEIALRNLKNKQENSQAFKKQFLTISEVAHYLELVEEIKLAEVISITKDKLIELDMD
jgi:hypothetical protein